MRKGDSTLKNIRRIFGSTIFLLVLLCGTATYATEVKPQEEPKTPVVTKENVTDTVTFEKDEYVRITQPTKMNTATFDAKMNVMGEARVGTNIKLEVQNIKSTKEAKQVVQNTKVYELNTVGVTKTFNQLIELAEGENHVLVTYTHEKNEEINGTLTFIITREPESKKEALKNYIVTTDKLENVVK